MSNPMNHNGGKTGATPGALPLRAKPLGHLIEEIDAEMQALGKADATPFLESPGSTGGAGGGNRGIQHIRFTIDGLICALPLVNAIEISHRMEVVRLPNVPDWLVGVGNLRGEVISVVDLRGFLNLPQSKATQGRHLIVTRNGEVRTGLVVDRILGMLSLDPASHKLKQRSFRKEDVGPYIAAVFLEQNEVIHVLDCDRLFATLKSSV